MVVDTVFHIGAGIGAVEEPPVVRFVLREQQWQVSFAVQDVVAQQRMRGAHRFHASWSCDLPQQWFRGACRGPLCPVIAKPERRQQMQLRWIRATVGGGDPYQQVFGTLLAVLDEHIEIPVAIEHPGIEQLVLHFRAAARGVRPDEIIVGIGGLRVLVEILHP